MDVDRANIHCPGEGVRYMMYREWQMFGVGAFFSQEYYYIIALQSGMVNWVEIG
jgi:hypothetical protein